MKTAQRMVDAAAEAAGFTIGPVYHGTKGKKKNIFPFTVFDTSRRGSLTTQVGTPSGSYFTPNKRYAEGAANYASNMGRSGKPVVGAFYLRSDVEKTPGVETEIEFFATNPSQIKSADPVTYDDSGNVIPLSQRFSSRSEDIRNPRRSKGDNKGININDEFQDFTGQILRGEKTIETRDSRSLDSRIGKLTGIIRTGIRNQKATLVGYAVIGEPVVYDSVAKFRRDYKKHLVAPGSEHDIKNGLKYGYPLMQVETVTPKELTSRGNVIRQLNPAKRNPMDPRSSMTQIEGTKKTYAKAAKMITGKVIDYGAGLGIGSDILRAEGLSVDSFEPYPEKWKGKRPPTYTDSAKIPSSSYDSLVSFSVINVVEPDMRKFLFQEVDRILRPNGVALITGRSRSDVEKSTTKIPHLEEGGYLVDEGEEQRYQKGFTQAELERYAKEVLGPGFTVQKNGSLNGASIKISKGKTNPVTRSMIRTKLSRILEPGDRVLDYDRAQGEDLYRLWDMVHTDKPLTKEALTEIEGLLDDDGVLVIQSGEEPNGLKDHFRRATRYQGMLLVQGPMNPEEARINTEKLRRDLE